MKILFKILPILIFVMPAIAFTKASTLTKEVCDTELIPYRGEQAVKDTAVALGLFAALISKSAGTEASEKYSNKVLDDLGGVLRVKFQFTSFKEAQCFCLYENKPSSDIVGKQAVVSEGGESCYTVQCAKSDIQNGADRLLVCVEKTDGVPKRGTESSSKGAKSEEPPTSSQTGQSSSGQLN